MKRLVLSILFLVLSANFALAEDRAKLQDGQYVAIIGDSITEQRIYSAFMEDYFLMCKPAVGLQATQFGWGGEQAGGFLARMENDLFPFGSNVATTCYGMNDGGYNALDDVRRKTYHDNLAAIVQKLKGSNFQTIVVGSPGAVDSDSAFKGDTKRAAVYNQSLAEECDIAKKVADGEHVFFANVHDPMMDVMNKMKAKYGNTYLLCGTDGVHPDRNGHLVMAYAFLKALGCDGNIGTITVDLAANTAKGTDGQKIISVDAGKVKIESSKFPFCFFGDPKAASATTGVIEFLPFNDDLNRYTLIVTGATTPKVKVTWGNASKEFATVDVAKGINLAAEFLDNPFCDRFQAVDAKVHDQQAAEVDIIRYAMHNLAAVKRQVPERNDLVQQITNELVKKDNSLREAAAAAAAVPVTHEITIEAMN